MKAHERVATKTCLKCGMEKPVSAFYAKPKARCKACVSAASREQYERTKERVLARGADYRAANKERIKEYLAEWYERRKDHVLERCRRYNALPEVKSRERERQAVRYAAKRDAIQTARRAYYESHPKAKAALNEYVKEHYRANKAMYTAKTAKRRSGKMCATPKWADLRAIAKVYKLAEQVSKQTGVRHVVDHIVPLQGRNVCGLHIAHNLQVISELENLRKANKHQT